MPLGRTFLRRLLDLLKGHYSKQSRFIHLNKECKLDIDWWRSFLPDWDGVYFFDLPDWATVPDLFLSPLMPLAAPGTVCFIRENGLMAPGLWPNNHRALPTRNFSP